MTEKNKVIEKLDKASAALAERFDKIGEPAGELWSSIAKEVYRIAIEKKWYNANGFNGPNKAERIALLHSELSEALEAIRIGDPVSEKIPPYSALEEELADVVIRIMDMSEHYQLEIMGAVLTKIEYNQTRPNRHGGKEL